MDGSSVVEGPNVADGRTGFSMFLTATTLTLVTAVGAKHLATLRQQPAGVTSYHVLASLVFPTFPIVDLVISVFGTIKKYPPNGPSTSRLPWRYLLCRMLDVRAITETQHSEKSKPRSSAVSIPLHLLPCERVLPKKEAYSLAWLTRLLFAILLQLLSLLTIALWLRRAAQGGRTFLDDSVAANALGTFIITTMSINILILNTSWTCPFEYAAKYEKFGGEPGAMHFLIQMIPDATTYIELQTAAYSAMLLQSASFMSFWTTLRISPRSGVEDLCSLDLRGLGFISGTLHGGGTASCHPTRKAPLPFHEHIFGAAYSLGYYFAFLLSLSTPLIVLYYVVQMIRGRKLRVSTFDRMWVGKDPIRSSGSYYLLFSWCLCAMTIWDTIDHVRWEQWMWKDPWAERIWRA